MAVIKFSVIIPLFNKENSIQSTVQSVLNQSYADFELIIVNDGSTDNSLNVVEQFDDERIKVLDRKNGGVSSARNAGIKFAKNDWIALLDGDDLWLPSFLENICQMIKSYPQADILSVAWNYEDGSYKFPYTTEGYLANYFKASLNGSILSSSSIVVKSSCFDAVGYFNERLTNGEDLEMWSRLSRSYNIAFSPQSLSVYRVMTENRACENRKMDVKKHFAYELSLEHLESKFERRYYRKIIRDCIMHCIKCDGNQQIPILMQKHGKVEIVFDFLILQINRVLNLFGMKQLA